MTQTNATFDELLMKMLMGYSACHIIHAANTLGIPELLAGGPKNLDRLAAESGGDAPSIARLLRALAALGLLKSDNDGGYSLTPFGDRLWLDASTPRPWELLLEGASFRAWEGLTEHLRDGRSAFEHVHGARFYDHYATHPNGAKVVDAWMARSAQQWLTSFARSYDFRGGETVVDVGGGQGRLIAEILRANPSVRGVLVDLPHVVAGAPAVLAEAGVADRCTVLGGSAFDSVPDGGDVYLLSRVLFNWSDERAGALLSSCRRAMRTGAKLVIIDGILSKEGGGPGAALWDLFLAVQFGAKLRTEDEFRALLTAAGFEHARTALLETELSNVNPESRFYTIEAVASGSMH